MATIHVSGRAREDLAAIERFCAEVRGAEAGISLALQIVEKVRRTLGTLPDGGRQRPELGPGVRSFPVPPFVVVYRVQRHRVEVIRVLHGHRDMTMRLLSMVTVSNDAQLHHRSLSSVVKKVSISSSVV